ncbi:sigma factor-like helix-turn-helix DNA-binding protein [Actinomadura violacea]|uniref:Helix-turn-helix domain-containing protein n=1 Tax=Actinomadura violacea TaxID=2819934 RepID=A0ABS3S877_9ACTN|nr:sigma factor-like helix-turn-helix DNA-binding protein [Actinomadura violacea]MBO2465194.1 helix-turn-helix domain-containing protein [Actinomadura violacea]
MKSTPAEDPRLDRLPPHELAAHMVSELGVGLAQLSALGAVERAMECEALSTIVRSLLGELAAARRAALIEARDSGMTLTQIAAELGVSVQAVSKAIKNLPGTGRSQPKEEKR